MLVDYLEPMSSATNFVPGIDPGETASEFSARARKVLVEAESLSVKMSGSFSELDRWTAIAKMRGMTWMEGMCFSIDGMKEKRRMVI
jgi:hypothetical protein